MFRLYLAVESDEDEGHWLILVWEDRARVPVGIRYSDPSSLYRGARRILRRACRGEDPLKQLRQGSVEPSSGWRRKMGRRVDQSDAARLLHGAGRPA